MNQNLVDLQNLKKEFDGTPVLRGISLSIKRREFVTLLGPSGCGKTTTLRIIGGFEQPDSGDVFFDGKRLNDVPPYQREINTVFQRYALFPHLNVAENIAFGLHIKKLDRADIKRKTAEMLELVGLRGFENRDVTSLSGGQQQRVAIARALVKMPHVLLLDEPLSNLDARLRLQTREEIRRIQRETKITTIFVTHDQEEAMSICDLIAVMKDGILQQLGKPQDVYDFPSNLFVAKFLGTPPINVFHGFVKDQTLFIGKNAVLATPGVSDQKVTAGIRPEGLIYRPDGPLSCHMNRIEVMGRDTSITASHPDCENPVIRAITNTDKLPDPGARTVSFSLKPGKVHLFHAETGERIPFSTNHEVNSYE